MPGSDPPAPQNSPAIDQLLAVAEARAKELEPFAKEFAQLSQVISLLREPGEPRQIPHLDVRSGSLDVGASDVGMDVLQALAGGETPAPAFKGRRGTRPGRDGRAPQGSNKQQIMGVIARRPGVKAREVAEVTGLKRSVVNTTVSRLKRQGELHTVNGGLHVSPDAIRDTARTADSAGRADVSAA